MTEPNDKRMSMKPGEYEIPFNVRGDLINYPDTWTHDGKPKEWRENIPFQAKMRVSSSYRGRSAAGFTLEGFTLEDECLHYYPMFMADFIDMLGCSVIDNGVIMSDSLWCGVKRGCNYGIRMYKPNVEV